ncbi:hypothetical protein ACXYTJ_10205 [Gilvimarinus sp. F26214L]|uniref:hypothetical protein n=1 Tax=Gilvimarinus sp. DZF01 TaxID=3461371 RepID=UPI00404611E0
MATKSFLLRTHGASENKGKTTRSDDANAGTRVILPGLPQAVFVQDKDYCYYLENLAEWKKEQGLEVYSYCLMTNHVT